MSILSRIFGSTPRNTASIAKERLKIVVSHERMRQSDPDYLPLLQKELIDVIAKYVDIDPDQVNVALDRDGARSVLELNITLPDISCKKPREKVLEGWERGI